MEATTRQRPAGATSTGDGQPLPGAEKNGGDDATEAGGGNLYSNSDLPIYPDLESLSVPKTPILKNETDRPT